MTEPSIGEDAGGATVRRRFAMAAKPGSHVAYDDGANLIVEWYDFGEHAPYESVNLLIFDETVQPLLAESIGADVHTPANVLASKVAERFHSYFEVREFADDRIIPYDHKVSFDP